jgi:dTDP-L-rhamnose 4-epimerase
VQTRVLVTGGAGFIGSHTVDLLLRQGYRVSILDSLVEQVHGPFSTEKGNRPAWVDEQIERGARFYLGDVRDREQLGDVLRGERPHVVIHLAAEVGVGQAEAAIERYVDANVRGTAVLLEELLRANGSVEDPEEGIRRLIVAGSMSSYGEGAWFCTEHGPQRPVRTAEQLAVGAWTPRCIHTAAPGGCNAEPLIPLPLEEWASLRPSGVYAATKRDTEELALLVARSSGLSVAACRFFNVYGPRQALSNPYTGVCAIFAGRVLRGLAPRVYEDGGQARDFIHVSDVAEALSVLCGNPETRLALRKWASPGMQGVFNVGTGVPTTIAGVAELACDALCKTRLVTTAQFGPEGIDAIETAPALRPEVTGAYRLGDVRTCLAAQASPNGNGTTSPSRLRSLGWEPKVGADQGLRALFESWRGEQPSGDAEAAHTELLERGLLLSPPAPAPEDEEPAPGSTWGT